MKATDVDSVRRVESLVFKMLYRTQVLGGPAMALEIAVVCT